MTVKIVFAFSGPQLPAHHMLNLSMTMVNFPELEVLTVVDSPTAHLQLIQAGHKSFLSSSSERYQNVKNRLSHDPSFWGGFWFLTIKRFFLLQDFIEKTGSCDVLHVESDVIIMPNFPFETFADLECELAFPMVDTHHAAASVMYIRNQEAIESLINYIDSDRLTHDDTDMRILAKYAKENSNVCILPSKIESENSEDGRKGTFEGVFDGATYGQYLFGLEPRNNLGRRILFQPLSNHHVKAHNYSYEVTIINDRYGLKVLHENGQKYPIYNLHIHSKDLRAFMIKLDEPEFLIYRCKQASAGKIKVEFVPAIFLSEFPSILKYIPHLVLKLLKNRLKS